MNQLIKLASTIFFILIAVVGGYIVINLVPDRPVAELQQRWAASPSQFLAIDGMQIHLRDEGLHTDATPIVLLHGTSASLHTWDGWVDALKEDRRVIRFDMPAFGLTGPAPDNNYTIERYARTVIAVLDKLNIERCVLVGNSLGGYVAWVTTVLHPDRVTRLTLIDASGYPYEAASEPIAFTLAKTPVLRSIFKDVLPSWLVKRSLENVYGNPSLVTSALVDRYLELTTRAGNRQALIERFQQTRPGPIADRVKEIRVPTLILWGDHDRLIPLTIADRFQREIANSQLIRFEQLGHVPHEEDPQSTVAAFKAFLTDTDS